MVSQVGYKYWYRQHGYWHSGIKSIIAKTRILTTKIFGIGSWYEAWFYRCVLNVHLWNILIFILYLRWDLNKLHDLVINWERPCDTNKRGAKWKLSLHVLTYRQFISLFSKIRPKELPILVIGMCNAFIFFNVGQILLISVYFIDVYASSTHIH